MIYAVLIHRVNTTYRCSRTEWGIITQQTRGQTLHCEVLRRAGCMKRGELIFHRAPPPEGDTWERAQAAEPGPGAYEIEYLRSGAKSSVAAPSRGTSGPKESGFQSDALRELPWEV